MGAVSCATNRVCHTQLLGLLVKCGANALLHHVPMCAGGMAVKLILTSCLFKKKKRTGFFLFQACFAVWLLKLAAHPGY